MTASPTIRVMALHALAYCERLFYLEEVEEIRVADEAVWAGRRLHAELDEPAEITNLTLESEVLGIRGRMDAVRRRDGAMFPIEHKRGRCSRTINGEAQPWDSDAIQLAAYAMLLEEHTSSSIPEARVRYHKDNLTLRVPIDENLRGQVIRVVERAGQLRVSTERPPVTVHERRCVRCSLAPVCLPEEARFAQVPDTESKPTPVRLFPIDTERRSVHVVSSGARVTRSGETLVVVPRDGKKTVIGTREVSDVVLHGFAQITTQALRLCASADIPVHFIAASGSFIGSFAGQSGGVQRRIRQFEGLRNEATSLELARRLVIAKIQMQIQHIMRASRGKPTIRTSCSTSLVRLRAAVRGAFQGDSREQLMGYEGQGARAYFDSLRALVSPDAGESMVPQGRSKRPPLDRFNSLLSFAYGLL